MQADEVIKIISEFGGPWRLELGGADALALADEGTRRFRVFFNQIEDAVGTWRAIADINDDLVYDETVVDRAGVLRILCAVDRLREVKDHELDNQLKDLEHRRNLRPNT